MKKNESLIDLISDTVQLRIMNILLHGEHCLSNLIIVMVLPQTVVSHHLNILTQLNLLTHRKSGLWDYYKPNLTHEMKVELAGLLRSKASDPVFAADISRLEASSLSIPEPE